MALPGDSLLLDAIVHAGHVMRDAACLAVSPFSKKASGPSKSTSVIQALVEAIFEDLRAETRVSQPWPPSSATLTAAHPEILRNVVRTYLGTRVIDEALSRGIVPIGATRRQALAKQAIVVPLEMPRRPRNPLSFRLIAERIRPSLFLTMLFGVGRPGETELVIVRGVEDMVASYDKGESDPGCKDGPDALVAARALPTIVNAPVAHVCRPAHRRALCGDSRFAASLLWEFDLFQLGAGDPEAAEFFSRRALELGFTASALIERLHDLAEANGPGNALVYDGNGDLSAAVAANDAVEAVKSCGLGAFAVARASGERGSAPTFAIARRGMVRSAAGECPQDDRAAGGGGGRGDNDMGSSVP